MAFQNHWNLGTGCSRTCSQLREAPGAVEKCYSHIIKKKKLSLQRGKVKLGQQQRPMLKSTLQVLYYNCGSKESLKYSFIIILVMQWINSKMNMAIHICKRVQVSEMIYRISRPIFATHCKTEHFCETS